MPDTNEMLTVSEAATLLGVSAKTMRKWTDEGIVQAVRLPGRGDRRIAASDLQQVREGLRPEGRYAQPALAGAEVYGSHQLEWYARPTDDGRAVRCWVHVYGEPGTIRVHFREFAVELLLFKQPGTPADDPELLGEAVSEALRRTREKIDRGDVPTYTHYQIVINREGRVRETPLMLPEAEDYDTGEQE